MARRNPADEALLKRLRLEPYETESELAIAVYLGERLVAEFAFDLDDPRPGEMTAWTSEVHDAALRRKGVASYVYDWAEMKSGRKARPNGLRTKDGISFWSQRLRPNPPNQRLRDAEHWIRRNRGLLLRSGASSGRVLGCGANGCAVPAKATNAIVKVTKDKSEIALVTALDRIRHRPPPRVSRKKRLALARIGTTPAEVARLPGFVLVKGRPTCHGKWCIYRRERLAPLDADRSKSGRTLLRKVRRGLDGFFYEGRYKDPVKFIAKYPELKTITQTVLGLLWVYGITTEDIHEQQVGRVIHGRRQRRRGTLVLYDGQVFGRLPRATRRDPGSPRLSE